MKILMTNITISAQLTLCALAAFLSQSAMATTIAEHLVDKHDKLYFMEGHGQPSTSSGKKHDVIADPDKIKKPLARAIEKSSKMLSEEKSMLTSKTLLLDIIELKDSSGLVYLGGKVSKADLSPYLKQLYDILGKEEFATYRQSQAARDHHMFHVTLINPYEYQTINKNKINLSHPFRVTLHGLGHVEKDNKNTYFVVASSSDGQYIRQNLILKNKDFHVTLGFSPSDIYGVSKGRDTLIGK